MMRDMPYDPSHEEVYNAFIMKTEPKTEVFSAKPTETDRQETFWNRNNTRVGVRVSVRLKVSIMWQNTIIMVAFLQRTAMLTLQALY